jgi:ssRNA-specific RNase YbeY (16S rRNA maturation enzyme)
VEAAAASLLIFASKMPTGISILNKTSRTLQVNGRDVPFEKIKDTVLGKKYELSLAFVGAAESRKVTLKAKNKDKASNVLSFELSKTSGEIIICPAVAKPYSIPYLFIHGLFHLKGFKHSDTMERNEHRLVKKFGLSVHE